MREGRGWKGFLPFPVSMRTRRQWRVFGISSGCGKSANGSSAAGLRILGILCEQCRSNTRLCKYKQ